MPRPQEPLPKLIRLPPRYRRPSDNSKGQNDNTNKTAPPPKRKSESIANVEEEKNGARKVSKTSDNDKVSDCNQNYITENDQIPDREAPEEVDETQRESSTPIPVEPGPSAVPAIEDISSEDEPSEPFEHYNTYQSKLKLAPSAILQKYDVSPCSLIKSNVEFMEQAIRTRTSNKKHLYTKPIVPKQFRDTSGTENPQGTFLSNLAKFKKDRTSTTCEISFRSPSERGFMSPNGFSPSPQSPVTPVRQMVPTYFPTQSPPDPRPEWQDFISTEHKKGFFNFARSLSTDSGNDEHSVESASNLDLNRSTDNSSYEVKVGSKVYTIKKSTYERIPKGKLCFAPENNTLVRYFDDKQMELFMQNLNINESSLAASDLLKQAKERSDIEVYDTSTQNEIITLPEDVQFLTDDFISDPEVYIKEMERVKRYIPKDFFGFYKYVTGYQIINNHPPISFRTFLTMHNTNGLRGLFKNYVNTLAQGKKASCIPEDFEGEF